MIAGMTWNSTPSLPPSRAAQPRTHEPAPTDPAEGLTNPKSPGPSTGPRAAPPPPRAAVPPTTKASSPDNSHQTPVLQLDPMKSYLKLASREGTTLAVDHYSLYRIEEGGTARPILQLEPDPGAPIQEAHPLSDGTVLLLQGRKSGWPQRWELSRWSESGTRVWTLRLERKPGPLHVSNGAVDFDPRPDALWGPRDREVHSLEDGTRLEDAPEVMHRAGGNPGPESVVLPAPFHYDRATRQLQGCKPDGGVGWRLLLPSWSRPPLLDPQGRVRFLADNCREVWSVNPQGEVTRQPIPEDMNALMGEIGLAPDGSTVMVYLHRAWALPPPGAPDASAETCLRESLREILNLGEEDTLEAGLLPSVLHAYQRLNEDFRGQTEPSWRLDIQKDVGFLKSLCRDRGVSLETRRALLDCGWKSGSWLFTAELWRDRLTLADTPEDRERLYRALPSLVAGQPEPTRAALEAMPAANLLGCCRQCLGENWTPGPEASCAELAAAVQALTSCSGFPRMYGGPALIQELFAALPPGAREPSLKAVGDALHELPFERALAFIDRARHLLARSDLEPGLVFRALRCLAARPDADLEAALSDARVLGAGNTLGGRLVEAPDFVSINGLRLRKRQPG